MLFQFYNFLHTFQMFLIFDYKKKVHATILFFRCLICGFSIGTLENGSFWNNLFASFSSQKPIIEPIKDHNKKWPYIPNHPFVMLIIGGSGTGKTNALLNLIKKKMIIILLTTFIYKLKTSKISVFN